MISLRDIPSYCGWFSHAPPSFGMLFLAKQNHGKIDYVCMLIHYDYPIYKIVFFSQTSIGVGFRNHPPLLVVGDMPTSLPRAWRGAGTFLVLTA